MIYVTANFTPGNAVKFQEYIVNIELFKIKLHIDVFIRGIRIFSTFTYLISQEVSSATLSRHI